MINRDIENIKRQELLKKQVAKLMRERQKILEAYLADALPLDLVKQQQKRIADELFVTETKLESLDIKTTICKKFLIPSFYLPATAIEHIK